MRNGSRSRSNRTKRTPGPQNGSGVSFALTTDARSLHTRGQDRARVHVSTPERHATNQRTNATRHTSHVPRSSCNARRARLNKTVGGGQGRPARDATRTRRPRLQDRARAMPRPHVHGHTRPESAIFRGPPRAAGPNTVWQTNQNHLLQKLQPHELANPTINFAVPTINIAVWAAGIIVPPAKPSASQI